MNPSALKESGSTLPCTSAGSGVFAVWLSLLVILGGFNPCEAGAAALVRKANTTLKMPQKPAFAGYNLSDAFGPLSFVEPVGIASPPAETNRLFVVERVGRISVITNLAQPNQTTFLDLRNVKNNGNIESGLMGLAFHPGFATNRYFYVFQTRLYADVGYSDVVLRFEVSASNRNLALPESETVIMKFPDPSDEHNAGDLHFGPDGYLYVPMGDMGSGVIGRDNPQALDESFFGGILRIDVDNRPTNLFPNPLLGAILNYRVPADNPFIGKTNYQGFAIAPGKLRTEFYAVGFRNPWRICFDSQTGALITGDVGGGEVEEVDVVTKGANYGWPYFEGPLRYLSRPTVPANFPFTAPLVSYTHGRGTNQGVAVVGGVVYRGTAIPALAGAYIFADNVRGNIWVTYPFSATTPKTFTRILGETGISAFGTDPRNKDILVVNHQDGSLKRLTFVAAAASNVPSTLALAGVFSDLKTLSPTPGVEPYEINLPFWSDHAIKSRYFSLPNTNQTFTFAADGNWQFPTGTVWIKHFEMEMTNGVPQSRRRLETRLLVKTAGGAYGVTYKWDAAGTSASLVSEAGLDERLIIRDGSTTRTQTWHYPTRGECMTCHTREGGYALGFSTAQLNVRHAYGAVTENEIKALSDAGYLANPPSDLTPLRTLALATDTNAPLEFRARSYFAANCAPCHQTGGTHTLDVFWDARIASTLAETHLLQGYIVAGDVSQSRVIQRLSNINNLMPPVGTAVINTNAVNLLTAWITGLPTKPWASKDVGATAREGSSQMARQTFEVSGAGTGVGGVADQFQFLYQPVTGHVQVVARVLSHRANDPQAQAGLVMRTGSGSGDPFAMAFRRGDGSGHFLTRASAGSAAVDSSNAGGNDTGWLKLVREGTLLKGYSSADGTAWQLIGQHVIPLSEVALAGFGVSSLRPYEYSTAAFTNVSFLSATLLTPDQEVSYTVPARVPIQVHIPLGAGRVQRVAFFAGSTKLGEASAAPYELVWTNGLAGDYWVGAVVTDLDGSELATEQVLVHLTMPSPDAFFVSAEPSQTADWQGHFGSSGQIIAGDATNLPPGIAVGYSNVPFQSWEIPSVDPRALRRSVGPERVAAGWGGSERWTMDIAFLDGGLHRLTLYCVDWDHRGRSQDIEVISQSSGEVLDRRRVSDFSGGTFLSWALRGRIRLAFSGSSTTGGAVVSGVFFDESQNQPPVVTWAEPAAGQSFVAPTNVLLRVDAVDQDGSIAKVEFFADDVKLGESVAAPYAITWQKPLAGTYEIVARATDRFKEPADSAPLSLTIGLPASTARFMGSALGLGGNWKGLFGGEGFQVVNSGKQLPPFLTLKDNGTRTFSWEDGLSDPRALVHVNDPLRVAACWVASPAFTLDLSFNDGAPHILTCYFLDWDSVSRKERILLIDPKTGLPLDSEEMSEFHDGKYLRWLVQGRVLMKVLQLEGNAVTSGIFIDSYVPDLHPAVLERVDGKLRIVLSWSSFAGQFYSVESSPSLEQPTWIPVSEPVAATSNLSSAVIEVRLDEGQRFYRIHAH